MVGLRLKANDFLVSEAFTAEEGVKKAEEERPDLVLLDILLPDGDGYEICRKLKSNPKTRGIAIVIFTASNLKDLAKKAVEAVALDYVVKPFEPKELLEKINKA